MAKKEIVIAENRDFKGIWIPERLYLTREFTPNEKFLLIEIYSLTKKKSRECFANNKHFADFVGLKENTVQKMMLKFENSGYIKRDYEYREGTKEIERRTIKLTQKFYESFINESEKPDSSADDMENNPDIGGIESMEDIDKNPQGDGLKVGEKYSNVKYNDDLSNINSSDTDKYALKDKSFKDCNNMYASVSEKQEDGQKPNKKSRYIPKDYTEEQLREHIRPTIRENFERIEIENGLGHIPGGEKLLEDITVEFFRQYEENMGVKHNILPDKSYINVIRMFVCSTDELREYFDFETYEIMIKRYFETDFNRYGKYDGEVTLCLSHFMNDTIRNHLLNREGILWERAEEEED